MIEVGTRRITAIAEVAFVGFCVVGLTMGPLYQVRLLWSNDGELATDPAVIAWYLLIDVIAAGLIVLRRPIVRRRCSAAGIAFLAVLTAVLVASSLWSYSPGYTAVVTLQVASTVVVGVYLTAAAPAWRLVAGLAIGLHVGLVWSAVRIRLGVSGSLDTEGNWTGVYFNRNSLAPVAVFGLMVCLALLVIAIRELRDDRPGMSPGLRRTAAVAGAAAIAALAVLDVRLYIGTGSRSAGVAAIVSIVVVGCLVACRRLVALGWSPRRIGTVGGALLVAVGATTLAGRDLLPMPQGWTATLDRRTAVWSVAVEFWGRRPVQGWGYLSMWDRNPEFSLRQLAANDLAPVSSAHNTLVEVLLGGGVIAALAAVGALAVGWMAHTRRAVTTSTFVSLAPVVVWLYCVGLNAVETFAVANSLYWALLAGGVAAGRSWGARPLAVASVSTAHEAVGDDETGRRYGARRGQPELVRRP